MNPDALIIGAGPVGLAAAIELARYGLSVRIVDKAPAPTDKSKALVLWPRTLELMDRMGCTASFIEAGFKVRAANMLAGSQQLAHITLDAIPTPYPFALMLPQSDTERLLTQHLRTFNIEVERSLELTHFTPTPEGVTVTLTGVGGQTETVMTSCLIGCDGAHSTVRHQLNLPFTGDTLPSDWILADLHLSGLPTPGDISIGLNPEGVLAIFPITADRFRVIADVGSTPAEASSPLAQQAAVRPDPTLDEVQAILHQRGHPHVTASNPIWLAAFRINERKVADYRSGHVFLAGDAAHIHSPAGGQGMNTGIQDACNLAWKLALVHHGLCKPEPLLSSYSIERSAVGDQVLKNAGRLTSFGILKGGVKQSIRNHLVSLLFGFSAARHLMADTLAEISIGYPKGPLTVSHTHLHGTPSAGERAPIRPSETPAGAGPTPLFALFAAPDDITPQLLDLYPKLLEPTLREPFHPDGLWLVRPDGYIALTAAAADWPTVAAYLDNLTT
jgi:2-polyprenyl-6-methoxyphenol hydroxylase-like FAD-dependent oxidoreductase